MITADANTKICSYPFCDVVQVRVWEDLAETMVYKVEVGMIDHETSERLPIFDVNGNSVPVVFVADVLVETLDPKELFVPEPGDNNPIHLTESQLETGSVSA